MLNSKITLAVLMTLPLVACDNKHKFSGDISLSSIDLPIETPVEVVVPTPTPVPPTPTPVPPTPTPVPPPVYTTSSGNCANNSSTQLLSCMNCAIPATPVPAPQLSQKGSHLLESMTLSCQVRNSSDPAGYIPPTRSQLLARMNRLSTVLYPDSTMTSTQRTMINGLLSTSSNSMRQLMFGGLWYQPPYSDAFETYFGIEVAEARFTLCYNDPTSIFRPSRNVTSEVHSKNYYDCLATGSFSCTESTAYINANIYRKQLGNAMYESIVNPWTPPTPATPKTCSYEKISGLNGVQITTQLQSWLSRGFTVGIEIPTQGVCAQVNNSTQYSSTVGEVIAAGYSCSN